MADNLYRYQSVAKMGNWSALLRRVGIHPPRVVRATLDSSLHILIKAFSGQEGDGHNVSLNVD